MAKERDTPHASPRPEQRILRHLEQMAAADPEAPAFVQNRCFARLGWDRDVREFCRIEKPRPAGLPPAHRQPGGPGTPADPSASPDRGKGYAGSGAVPLREGGRDPAADRHFNTEHVKRDLPAARPCPLQRRGAHDRGAGGLMALRQFAPWGRSQGVGVGRTERAESAQPRPCALQRGAHGRVVGGLTSAQPLMQPIGRSCATFREMPARAQASTTFDTSL